MFRLEEFRWTTRGAVCEQLYQFLLATPPVQSTHHGNGPFTTPDRLRAARLLAQLADDAWVPALRGILLNRDEEEVRGEALGALAGLGATLPVDDLQELLEHAHPWDGEETGGIGLDEVLALCRSAEAQQIARRHLAGMSAPDRAQLLIRCGYDETLLAPQLVDWLYEQWLDEDRRLIEGIQDENAPSNIEVAIATQERPESRRFLVDQWRRADVDERRELLHELRYDKDLLAECVADNPADRQEVATALLLSFGDLVSCLGAEQLLLSIEDKIRAASRALRSDRSHREAWTDDVLRAFDLLEDWLDAGAEDRIISLALCPDLDGSVQHRLRHLLWERLWKRDRCRAVAVAREVAIHDPYSHYAEAALRRVASDPREADRDFLLWAAGYETRAGFRYYAVKALEKLGEDSAAWRQQLVELSRHSDGFVRLQAMGALVRRGEETCVSEIVRDAASAEDVRVRGEALQILAELDSERHFPILRRALLEDYEETWARFNPAAEEAALAMARLGTPAALTVMIQAYLVAPHDVWTALACYFECLLEPRDKPDAPISMYHLNWRNGGHGWW